MYRAPTSNILRVRNQHSQTRAGLLCITHHEYGHKINAYYNTILEKKIKKNARHCLSKQHLPYIHYNTRITRNYYIYIYIQTHTLLLKNKHGRYAINTNIYENEYK